METAVSNLLPGVVCENTFFERLFASPAAVIAALFVTGTFLIASSLLRATGSPLEDAPWWRASLVGLAQAVAIVPGRLEPAMLVCK